METAKKKFRDKGLGKFTLSQKVPARESVPIERIENQIRIKQNDIPCREINVRPEELDAYKKDCFVRATSVICGIDYRKVRKLIGAYLQTERFGNGRSGTPEYARLALMPREKWELNPPIKSLEDPRYGEGATLKSIVDRHPTCLVRVKSPKKGTYHVFAIVDGVAYDNRDIVYQVQTGYYNVVNVTPPKKCYASEIAWKARNFLKKFSSSLTSGMDNFSQWMVQEADEDKD